MINSFVRIDNNYHTQVFLGECKYGVREKKIPENITNDIEIYSDSDREGSDEEISNEENSDGENFNKEK